ncbi:MAG: protein TolR [Candidatus Pacebacteria bacterium]|nr:protein TolR [Candidatus Paceibacterota bacterium]
MSAGSGSHSSRRRRGRRSSSYEPMSQINVTPMVDVMLVLLVVFMVTAPLLTVGVPVNLPRSQAGAINDRVEPLTVSIKADGQVYLQESQLSLDMMGSKLHSIALSRPDTTVFVRADRAIAYGRVMEVMGAIAKSGFTKVSLITESSQNPPQSPAATKGGEGGVSAQLPSPAP